MEPDIYFEEASPKSNFNNFSSHLIDFIQTLVVFGAIFALIYLFIAQFHKVSGNSMVPTLHNEDYLITEKVSYKFGKPHRGQIIVLKNPKNESEDFIKRIIALPEDTIKVEANFVFVNGEKLTEDYLPPGTPTHSGAFLTEGKTIKVNSEEFFVFGDNRDHSSDSRAWGPITKDEIVGKAFFLYWPIERVGLLNKR